MRLQTSAVLLLLLAAGAAATPQGTTERVSLRDANLQGNGRSLAPSLSADGGRLAFMSLASDLAPGDTGLDWDVFVRDFASGVVTMVSKSPAGDQGNSTSQYPALSADGRWVAFQSFATNLVPGDTNSFDDVFLHDLDSGTTTRVSVASGGVQAAGGSHSASISADGRFIAFQSFATNLVPGDTNNTTDIFVHDAQTGLTVRVSVGPGGGQSSGSSSAPSISADGRYVAFLSDADDLVAGDTNATEDVFVHDLWTGTTTRASLGPAGAQANDYSGSCGISGDGRYVAFSSDASNLVGADTNGWTDIFVRDLQTGQTSRVSVGPGGLEANGPSYAPSLSSDGRYVGFLSPASNLVAGDSNGASDAFVHDRVTGLTVRVSVDSGGAQGNANSGTALLCADGTRVAFSSLASNLIPLDSVLHDDVFVHVLATGQTLLGSSATSGLQANGQSWRTRVSADGRYVVFSGDASNLVAGDTNALSDVFVRDRWKGTTERVSLGAGGAQGNEWSGGGCISANGRYVAFESMASNLVPGDTNTYLDVFVHDRWAGTTERVNVGAGGAQTNHLISFVWDISADGRHVAFSSHANNLVPGDTNGEEDTFVHDRVSGLTRLVNVSSTGVQGNDLSLAASLSSDGRYVAFDSAATALVPGDTNGSAVVFVHDQQTGATERVSLATGGAQGNDDSFDPRISGDGRYVAFVSRANNLVPLDTNSQADIFVRDRQTATTTRISLSSFGGQANGASDRPSISADGRFIAFRSSATTLVPGDTNGRDDAFVHDRQTGTTQRVNVSSGGAQANGDTDWPAISGEGRHVVFTSHAVTLVTGDTNAAEDAFLHDRLPLAPTAFCYGDGSGAACPCGNAGAFGRGCANGTFAGGSRLEANGEASISADTLVLSASDSPPGFAGTFIQGNVAVQGGGGVAFGDGLRCAGGAVVRLQLRVADVTGSASSTVSISSAGGVLAGDVRRYQWWYRDPVLSPCLVGFNLSNGLEVLWVP